MTRMRKMRKDAGSGGGGGAKRKGGKVKKVERSWPGWLKHGALVVGLIAVGIGVVCLWAGKEHGDDGSVDLPAHAQQREHHHHHHDDSPKHINTETQEADTAFCRTRLSHAFDAAKRSFEHKASLELSQCIDRDPSDPEIQLQIGELFALLKEFESALSWMNKALDQEPGSYHFLSRLIETAHKAGEEEAAVQATERGMETLLRLDTNSWHRTLLQTADVAPEDLQWIKDEPHEVVLLLRALVRLYEAVEWVPAANAAHKVLAKLYPYDAGVQQRFADFSSGVGLISQSVNASLALLQRQYEAAYPHHDARQPVVDHAIVSLAAGMDAMTINVARKILLVEDGQVLRLMSNVCDHDVTDLLSAHAVPITRALRFLESCLEKQDVIGALLRLGAKTRDVSNDFLFTPLHNAAALGSDRLVAKLLEAKADPAAANTLEQLPFHAAVLRGHDPAAKRLLDASGATTDVADRFGRTGADMVCLHGWAGFDWLLGDRTCTRPSKPYILPEVMRRPSTTTVGGGWRIKRSVSRQQAECDIEVVDGRAFSQEDFLLDFLSVQRPVLIKGALRGEHWDRVGERWSRDNFVSEFQGTMFQRMIIPYANAFGMEANQTSVSDFVEYMQDHHDALIKGIEDIEPPAYVFASLPVQEGTENVEGGKRTLAFRDFKIPEVIGPEVSEIVTRNKQFYLGPAGSGAPLHVHSGAWNALVYGRKRWFLLPPSQAVYSKQHPRDFVDEELPDLLARRAVLQCVQETGDVMFVPEMWAHAVLNEAESIGFASEFAWGGSVFSLPSPEEANEATTGPPTTEEDTSI